MASSALAAVAATLGIFAAGLGLVFVGGVLNDVLDVAASRPAGSLSDIVDIAPFVVLIVAAAYAYDQKLFDPDEAAPASSRLHPTTQSPRRGDPGLPVVSLIAITLLVAIPAIDQVARQLVDVSPATESLRTRVTVAMMIPFGIVVVVWEFLSRRALLRAGQDLASTREQLVQREKLAAVGQLVSGVAHELNNPLQGVLGYAELMLAARPAELETEELRAIRDNANRAAGIVRNLLTFAGRTSTVRGWEQINRIVRSAVATCQPHSSDAGIDISIEAADRLPMVYVDPTRLEDVVVNLIENAEAAIAARREGNSLSPIVPERARGEIVITTRLEPHPDRILVTSPTTAAA